MTTPELETLVIEDGVDGTANAVPETTPPPVPDNQGPNPIIAEQAAQIQQLQFDADQSKRQAEETQIADMSRQRQAQYVEAGYDADMAKRASEADLYKYQLEQERVNSGQLGRAAYAQKYAHQHGVTPESLMGFNTPAEMENHAKTTSTTNKDIAELKAEIAAMKQQSIPAQEFLSPGSEGSNPEGAALIQALDDGLEFTPARQKAAAKILGLTDYL